MYDYNYESGYEATSDTLGIFGGLFAMMGFISTVAMIGTLIMIISLWKIFTKAGQKGWVIEDGV